MNFYDRGYFKINKTILKICGLWPYQSRLESANKFVIFVIMIFSMVFAMVDGILSQKDAKFLIILETIIVLIYCGGGLIVCTILHTRKYEIKNRFEQIVDDWEKLVDDSERDIMRTFLFEARNIIYICIGYGIPAFVLFVCITFLPRIFNKKSVEYCLHSFPIYMKSMIIYENTCDLQVCVHFIMSIFYASSAFLSISATYVIGVKHVCAAYGIARHRLQNAIVEHRNIDPSIELTEDASVLRSLIKVIDMHKAALRGIQIIEKHFSLGFFFLEICALVLFAILVYEVNYYRENFVEFLRLLLILLVFIIYVFFINWCGEQVIQSCDDLYISAYNIDWYRISSRARIFVLMIIQRTENPVYLTAGTVMKLSIKNFATILKTAWSFGTILLTTQKQGGRLKNVDFSVY